MAACTSLSVSGAAAAAAKDVHRHFDGLRRSDSAGDLRCNVAKIMQRSQSDPQLKSSFACTTRAAVTEPARLKRSRSGSILPFPLPNSLRSFLFNIEDEESKLMLADHQFADDDKPDVDRVSKESNKVNWIERLLEVRNRWRMRQHKDMHQKNQDDAEVDNDTTCDVSYDSDEEEERHWDMDSFSRLLSPVATSDVKLFSKLAFLCNMAYAISDIKVDDLRMCYGLRLVTSSLEKKAAAKAIKAQLESDSSSPLKTSVNISSTAQLVVRPSVAYDIAASAAAHVHSQAKGNIIDPFGDLEVAAHMATLTMTAVVAAEEAAKQQAAKDLRSLHSAPCEWFVCDDPGTFTRCFVIQGSDSLASWQANLFFEPTKFEGTEAMVHRGIYEAAKGIYEQFLPVIEEHLRLHGDRARFRFTGHSLGGSLSVLVSLMLISRGVIHRSAVLPVVTFGSPSIFCGGTAVLDDLGLDEAHILSVMMHRDIVPRAFSCNYPNHIAQLLKRLTRAFRDHPCLNHAKLLYTPLGKQIILQPDEETSPPHPMLPPGMAMYVVSSAGGDTSRSLYTSALRAFLNSPHPLETLSDHRAYGSEGTILRDHESDNYLKAIKELLRSMSPSSGGRWLPALFTMPTGLPRHAWAAAAAGHYDTPETPYIDSNTMPVAKELVTGA